MTPPAGYVPALDGLRAVCVVAVLLFHADLGAASGGYLGVSVFFTLSGFVITRSLLARAAERPAGRAPLRLGDFYARRVKRLLPAALVTLVATAVASRAGWLPPIPAGELRWTTLNVANWYQLRSGDGYAELFASHGEHSAGDPLVHYWSLAIEEQFYLVWPLLMLLLLRLPRRTAAVASGVVTLALAATTIAVAPTASAATTYYHSALRAAEILVGAVAAFSAPSLFRHGAAARSLKYVGPIALLALLAAFVLTGSGTGAWPYRGWLPVFAIVSGAVVLGACVRGPVGSVLDRPALVYLGRISYGVYLFHWPIFVAIEHQGAPGWAVPVIGIPAAIATAAVSFHLVESRVTRSRLAVRPSLVGAFAGLAVALAATALVARSPQTTLAMPEIDDAQLSAVAFDAPPTSAPPIRPRTTAPAPPPTTEASPPSAPPATTAAPQPEPMRILVVGDSTGRALGSGLVDWAYTSGDAQVIVAAQGGCGLLRGGEYPDAFFNVALQMTCAEMVDEVIPAALPIADVVVILNTVADTWDRSWDGGDTWLNLADAEYRERLVSDYEAFVTEARRQGVPTVLWLRPPVASYGAAGDESADKVVDESFTNGEQEWIASVIDDLAERHPERFQVADLRAWFEAAGLADDPEARPDGTHFTADAARRIVDEWLGPLLAELPRRGPTGT